MYTFIYFKHLYIKTKASKIIDIGILFNNHNATCPMAIPLFVTVFTSSQYLSLQSFYF